MGGRVGSSLKWGKFRGSFTAVLASALLEWALIFMLIVYAIFGYLITKFARYCELPVPCLLCSRIDNILGGEKAGFYWDMICGNHKLEISSLVYCHFHEKLVDVRGMCENCLFSFATKDKSNAETYRLLVGKLGEEDLSDFDDETLPDDHLTNELKNCCCCDELWNPRRQTLLQTKPAGFDVSLSREASLDIGILEKEDMKTQTSSTVIHVREMTEDPGVHNEYTDLKITSDTESDFQDSLEREAEKTHASSAIIHVREKTADPLVHFGFTEVKITSDSESEDSLEKEAEEIQASSTIIHVREKTADPLVHFEFTEVKITSDSESEDSLEKEAEEIQASSTIIHVIEKTEDPLVHSRCMEVKTTSDSESDVPDTLEKEAKKSQESSIIHVREMPEVPLAHFGYTEVKFTSDCETDVQDILEKEGEKTQASSTIIHVKEKIVDPLVHFGLADLKLTFDNASDFQASDIHGSLENDAYKAQASPAIIHVRENTEDPLVHLGFTELKSTSGNESEVDNCFEEANIIQASPGIIHVREKTEDKSVHFGSTDLKFTSDYESDAHDTSEEAKNTQATSTIIHVREKSEDDFRYTDLKMTSDTESDFQASDIDESSEKEAKKTQASSTIIHVGEKTEDHPLDNFGFMELKTTSDNESVIHDSLEEAKATQASSTIIHIGEKMEDHFGYTDLKMTSDTESDIQTSDIEEARALISDDPLEDIVLESTEVDPFISMSEDALPPEYSQTSCDLPSSDIIHTYDSPLVVSPPAIGHGLEELNWQEIDRKGGNSDESPIELINVIEDVSNSQDLPEMINEELFANTPNGELNANEVTVQTVVHETDKNQELEVLQTTTNLKSSETMSEHADVDQQSANYLELSDAYKLAVSSRGRQSSEKLIEQLAGKNSSNTNLDLKLLLSQLSRGINLPSTGILSPRLSRNLNELKISDSSASLTMKLLQKRASLERNDSRNSIDRNESGVESLDFSTVGEIEGENELDRLKRQLEHDKKFLTTLLKELEEERSASASAANEAMAMITRLQEEKAALQMEASQELRMMEEQAEYDIDALDKLNDLLTEKEREIQSLEAELDYYRSKYPDELFQDDVEDPLSDGSRDGKGKSPSNDTWSITQDEREYISECLRNLEKKLSHFDVRSDETDEPKVISQKDIPLTKESRGKSFLVNEVSRLNQRLQVLEAGSSFVEHAINALNDGQEELVQEIASHLRELHMVGVQRYQTSIEDRGIAVER